MGEIAIDTEVIPAEAPWRLSITGTISNLLKRTATLYALDQGRQATCEESLLQAVMAHSRLLKVGGFTPLQLLFGHEPVPVEGELLDPQMEALDMTVSMGKRLARR